MMSIAIIIFAISSTIIGGLLYAFSTFIMRGFDETGPQSAIRTMQAINRTVFTPWVMVPFIGTAPFGLILAGLIWFVAAPIHPLMMTIAAGLYTIGVVMVTGFGNVPLNEHLDTVEPDHPESAAHWEHYLRVWSRLNHLRTALAIIASGIALVGLIPLT